MSLRVSLLSPHASPSKNTNNRKLILGAIFLCALNIIFVHAFIKTYYKNSKDKKLIGKVFIAVVIIEIFVSAFLHFMCGIDPFILFLLGGRFLEFLAYLIFTIFSTVLDRLS